MSEPAIPIDLAPESRKIFARMWEMGLLETKAETVEEMRALSRLERPLMGAPADVGEIEELQIETPAGALAIRVYRPKDPPARAILWLHGGGWVVGDLDHADVGCRSLCADTGSIVASVDYRLAPENRFPAGLEDAYAALGWLDEELASGTEPLPLIVGGDSAGGNLAAALCLLARDRGGPSIDHQVLIYPVTERDFETESYREYAEGYVLTRETMEKFWRHYLGDAGDEVDHLAAVLRAPNLRDLPPATVVVAGCDVLRDEAEAYAVRLREAAVPTSILRYAGQLHGFWSYADPSDVSHAVNADIRACLDSAK